MIDQESVKKHRRDVPIPKDLVPYRTVIADMCDPDQGYAAASAREYYYTHYADDDQRRKMDHEDRMWKIAGYVLLVVLAVAAFLSTLSAFGGC